MTRGYLLMAHGDYIKQAECLAASIKKTQSSVNSVSVITDQPTQSTNFDKILPMPKNDLAGDNTWKIHNRVYLYDLSPYEQTVILDVDMLVLSDISWQWEYFEKFNLLVTDKVKTFRGDWVTHSPYRQAFLENDLPNLYSGFCYFKKSEIAKTFFTLLRYIITDWNNWIASYAEKYRPTRPSIDVAMAIAAKVLGIEKEITSRLDFPTFTHMKGGCQGWSRRDEQWNDLLGTYIIDNNIKIGPYVQRDILHYVQKDWVSEDIMEIFK